MRVWSGRLFPIRFEQHKGRYVTLCRGPTTPGNGPRRHGSDTAHSPTRAGPQAAERTVEFFTAQIRNPHTRAAYAAAVTRFFTWCDARGLALAELSPIAVATYIDEMHGRYRAPTIK